MEIRRPYLLFLGDAKDDLAIKTAQGIADWRPEWCVAQHRLTGARADVGLPEMTPAEAAGAGAATMVVGAVNPGGVMPESWSGTIVAAIEAGLDIASGLHTRLASLPEVVAAAAAQGRALTDVRVPQQRFAVGNGDKRPGRRLLTVGTDCSIGKKYAALALEREMTARGLDATFQATGQTGILIAGRGVPLDAVIADFIAGAAEWLSPAAAPSHWDVIEGQGSLFHPSFAGVTLGLLHGSQPDAFVVCHEPTRATMRNVATPIATVEAVIEMTVELGRLTNPDIRCIGLAVNTKALEAPAAAACLAELAARHGLPACDPIRTGVGPIVDRLVAEFGA